MSLLIFPGGSDSEASAYNEGNPGSIPGSGRSPGEGNGNSLQYSCLENPMTRVWWATVHGVTKSWHDWATNTFTLASPLTISTRLVGLAACCSLTVVRILYTYFSLAEQQCTEESWVSKSWRRNVSHFQYFKNLCLLWQWCLDDSLWTWWVNE